MKLILGSSSPRRKNLLESAGFSFRILAGEADEIQLPGKGEESALRNARKKALAAGELFRQEWKNPLREETLLLGADTLIDADGRILGKPASEEEAVSFLSFLSGRTHKVITGVGLLFLPEGMKKEDPFPEVISFAETTFVTFQKLSPGRIREYMAKVPVLDKAGAYAIQEYPELIIAKVEGELDNVTGLPVKALQRYFAGKNLSF